MKEPVRVDIPSASEILETGTFLIISKEGISPGEIKIRIDRMAANKLLVFSIPLDLNRVSVEDLCLIPGIGASLAQEIVSYREKRRAFRSVEELRQVKGIGEKKWKAIKNFFVVTQSFGVDSSKP